MKKIAVCLVSFIACLLPQIFGENFTLALDTGIFSGQVVDVSKLPVEGAEIFIYTTTNVRGPADYISPPTDKDGGFRVSLPPGVYWAVARARQGDAKIGPLMPNDRHSGEPLEIEITTGETLQENFTVMNLKESAQFIQKIDAGFAKIQGRILDKDGQPIKNAYAYAFQEGAATEIPAFLSAWTDSSGTYTLFLPPGTYYLGMATEFPPTSNSKRNIKMSIKKDMIGVDIINNKYYN